jgi:membrane associated rhomboid family serine protease
MGIGNYPMSDETAYPPNTFTAAVWRNGCQFFGQIVPAPLTQSLSCLLIAIFILEQCFPVESANGLVPDGRTMTAFGAFSAPLILHGEWWRFFVGPLLHGGPFHLIEDVVGLMGVGLALEPLVGRVWFGALLAIGAIAGAVCSFVWLPAGSQTVGSSGAVMSALAANFVCSFRFQDIRQRRFLQKNSFLYLVPMLIGTFNGFHGAGLAVDISSHVGGTAAGVALGCILLLIWPSQSPKPRFDFVASMVVAGYVTACAMGFVVMVSHYNFYAEYYAGIISRRDFPQSGEEKLIRSRYYVEHYPLDPTAHLFLGEFYLQKKIYPFAEGEFRIASALAASPIINPNERNLIAGYLALALWLQGRRSEASPVAKPLCYGKVDDTESVKLQYYLLTHGLCS